MLGIVLVILKGLARGLARDPSPEADEFLKAMDSAADDFRRPLRWIPKPLRRS
jgi:hypothetical protein